MNTSSDTNYEMMQQVESIEDRKKHYSQIYDFHTDNNVFFFFFGCGFFRLIHLEIYNYIQNTNSASTITTYQILSILYYTIIPLILLLLICYFVIPLIAPKRLYYRWCMSRACIALGISRITLQFSSIWLSGQNNPFQIILLIICITLWFIYLIYGLGMTFAFRRLDHWAFTITGGILFDCVFRVGSDAYDPLCDPSIINIIMSIIYTLLGCFSHLRINSYSGWELGRRRDQMIIDGTDKNENGTQDTKTQIFGISGRKPAENIPPFHFGTGTELISQAPLLVVVIIVLFLMWNVFYLSNVYVFELLSNNSSKYFVLVLNIGIIVSVTANKLFVTWLQEDRFNNSRLLRVIIFMTVFTIGLVLYLVFYFSDFLGNKDASSMYPILHCFIQLFSMLLLSFGIIGFKSHPPIEQSLEKYDNLAQDPLGLETEPEWDVKEYVKIVALTILCTVWITNVYSAIVDGNDKNDLDRFKLFILVLFLVIGGICGVLFVWYREIYDGAVIAPVRGTIRHPFWFSVIACVFMSIMIVRVATGDIKSNVNSKADVIF